MKFMQFATSFFLTLSMNLFSLPCTEKSAIEYFQDKGVFPKQKICPNGHIMKLESEPRIRWRCGKSTCRSELGGRKGTWFEGVRKDFLTTLRFIYFWCFEMTSIEFCARELDMDDNTVIDYNSFMRCICVDYLVTRQRHKIGGPNQIVEIDESMFTKRKNNAGRVLPQTWVFGGICRDTRECFLTVVPDRSAKTLLNAICENINDGTTIYSDSWRGYKTEELEEAGFAHMKVNHKLNFVDPSTGTHTQTIERIWGSAKWRNKRHRGTARQHLDSYLSEFMCRQMIPKDTFFAWILEQIAFQYPV